ncbi:MAG: ATP-grasp domain-containing protein [Candidatus Saccharimonadales bacterium]
MKLLEYEAKNLLHEMGIPTPVSQIVTRNSISKITTPVVLKSQVPTGGRGKLGGIKVIESTNKLNDAISTLLKLPIKGFLPSTLLAEEKLNIKYEYYLSLTINRSLGYIELVAHKNGGLEVEENDTADFLRLELTGKNASSAGEQLAEYFEREDQSFALQDIIERLYACFIKNDATLIEINPLILTTSDTLVCGDAKIELDDAAIFRHSEWQFEEQSQEVNFVTLNETGDVATIANGAGLAMATVDAVSDHGLTPANFLDIGGGASTASILAAFERILKYPNISAIVINIFAGITRCDEIAKAIIAARQQIDNLPPLYIRLAGTNYETATEILKKENIPLFNSLEDSLAAIIKERAS